MSNYYLQIQLFSQVYQLSDLEDFPVNSTLLQVVKKNTLTNNNSMFNRNPNPNPEGNQLQKNKPINKNYEFSAVKDSNEELSSLLTPSDFLQKLLGNLEEQPQQKEIPRMKSLTPQKKIQNEFQQVMTNPFATFNSEDKNANYQQDFSEQNLPYNDSFTLPKFENEQFIEPKKKIPFQYNDNPSEIYVKQKEQDKKSYPSFSNSNQKPPQENPLQNYSSQQTTQSFNKPTYPLENQNTFYPKNQVLDIQLKPKQLAPSNKQSSQDSQRDNFSSSEQKLIRNPLVTFINSTQKSSPSNDFGENFQEMKVLQDDKQSKVELVKSKFSEQITRLQNRQSQILHDLDQIYERLEQKIQFQDSSMMHESAIKNLCSRVSIEFQLQLDLIIPMYCSIKNNTEAYIDSTNEKSPKLANRRELRSFEKTVKTEPSEKLPTFYNRSFVNNEFPDKQLEMNKQLLRKPSPNRRIFDEQPQQIQVVTEPCTENNQIASENSQLQIAIEKLIKGVNLEQIILKNQNIGDREIEKFSKALQKTYSYVRLIKLSQNQITDQGFHILIENIINNKTLKILNVKKNNLSEKSLDSILQFFQKGKNSYLQQIYMKDNQILWLKHKSKIQYIEEQFKIKINL